MANYSVYRIVNLKNKRVYFGSSSNPTARKAEHFKLLKENKHHNWQLQSDFARYGPDNFIFEVIIDGFENKQQMMLKEYELINLRFEENYNIDRICPILDGPKKHKDMTVQGKNGTYVIKKPDKMVKRWNKHEASKKKKESKPLKDHKYANFVLDKKLEREKRRAEIKELQDKNNKQDN